MKITQPTGAPIYCTECNDPAFVRVRFDNPSVVQQASFALCAKHAEQLASVVNQRMVRLRETLRSTSASRSPEPRDVNA